MPGTCPECSALVMDIAVHQSWDYEVTRDGMTSVLDTEIEAESTNDDPLPDNGD